MVKWFVIDYHICAGGPRAVLLRCPAIQVKAYSWIPQSYHFESGPISEIKLIPAVCPKCGASLNLPEGVQHLYCMYCGTQIIIGRADAEARIPCDACHGYGRVDICRACDGTGDCSWSTRGSGARQDIFMIGYSAHCEDGMCSACHGSGRYGLSGCPGCNGTGRCPQCLGTGKCDACHGQGSFPNPRGYDMCSVCHGSGMIDAGAPKGTAPSIAATCANCGQLLSDGNPQCPHCGFVRRACPQCGEAWAAGYDYCRKCGFGKSPA